MLPHETRLPGPAADFAATLRAGLPRIETARLVLRAPVLEDFRIYARIADEPGARFFLEEPSRDEAWYDFANMVALWLLRGHGLWAVDLKTTGETIGFVLLGFEPGDHEPELGYLFVEEAGGRGFATEAAEAARDHAFGALSLHTLVSTIDPGNDRSVALAERLGAVRDPAAEAAHDNAILVYRYPSPEPRP